MNDKKGHRNIVFLAIATTIILSMGFQSLSADFYQSEINWYIAYYDTPMTPNSLNLIGYLGESNDTAELFGQDIHNVSYLSKYDVYNDTFVTHIMGMSGNNFTTIHGNGYFVFLNSSGSTVYRRYAVDVTNYNTSLGHGWNIIAWTNSTMITAENITQQIGTNCTYASSYNGGTYTTHTKTFVSNDFNMTKGLGYYVHLGANMTWNRET